MRALQQLQQRPGATRDHVQAGPRAGVAQHSTWQPAPLPAARDSLRSSAATAAWLASSSAASTWRGEVEACRKH
jgi:hypothetical protein